MQFTLELPDLLPNDAGFREASFTYRGRPARIELGYTLRLWLGDLELNPSLVLNADEQADWNDLLSYPLSELAPGGKPRRLLSMHVELILHRFSDVLDHRG